MIDYPKNVHRLPPGAMEHLLRYLNSLPLGGPDPAIVNMALQRFVETMNDPAATQIAALPPVYADLAAAQDPRSASLWSPVDGSVDFTPAVLRDYLGDGRALFVLQTMNQRPRHYLVRGDSRWKHWDDYHNTDLGRDECLDHYDQFVAMLESQFGSVRDTFKRKECGAWVSIDTGEPAAPPGWPMVDREGGGYLWRTNWPELPGLVMVPFGPGRGTLLPPGAIG